MRRFSTKRVLSALLVCVFVSWVHSIALGTMRPKTLVDASKRPSPTHFNGPGAESPRNIGKFDLQLAKAKFQRVVNSSAVGVSSANAPISALCDSKLDQHNQTFLKDDFSIIHAWATAVKNDSKLVHLVKSSTPKVFIALR